MSYRRHLRQLLLALMITAGVLNYMDRQVIAVLKPLIQASLHWSDEDYGLLASIFQFSAALAFLVTGTIVDRLGVRWANSLGVAVWSIAAMAHGAVRAMGQFVLCRIALGASESMGTPAFTKTIAAILPPDQRSVGFGLSNAAGTLGAIVTPLVIPLFALRWGWRASFVMLGALGVAWAVLWLLATHGGRFDSPPVVARAETGHFPLLRERRVWAIAVAKFLSDQTWWLLLFWMPDFFHRRYGLGMAQIGAPLAFAYLCAALGSIIGGVLPMQMLRRGIALGRVRKGTMLAFALLVTPIPLALYSSDYRVATAVLGLALLGHQGFSTNLFALITDLIPRSRVGRVTAFGALVGNLGGMMIVYLAGLSLAYGYGYLPLFLLASLSYLMGLGWIQLMLPRVARASDYLPA